MWLWISSNLVKTAAVFWNSDAETKFIPVFIQDFSEPSVILFSIMPYA